MGFSSNESILYPPPLPPIGFSSNCSFVSEGIVVVVGACTFFLAKVELLVGFLIDLLDSLG
jgi:hypothetical protein